MGSICSTVRESETDKNERKYIKGYKEKKVRNNLYIDGKGEEEEN
jgi:hypothetical protein